LFLVWLGRSPAGSLPRIDPAPELAFTRKCAYTLGSVKIEIGETVRFRRFSQKNKIDWRKIKE